MTANLKYCTQYMKATVMTIDYHRFLQFFFGTGLSEISVILTITAFSFLKILNVLLAFLYFHIFPVGGRGVL